MEYNFSFSVLTLLVGRQEGLVGGDDLTGALREL